MYVVYDLIPNPSSTTESNLVSPVLLNYIWQPADTSANKMDNPGIISIGKKASLSEHFRASDYKSCLPNCVMIGREDFIHE